MPADPHAADSVTVLVVDDEPDIRFLVRELLRNAEGLHLVEEAVDGRTALEALAQLDPPPVPTVMVLDNQMPGLSGVDVAEQVLRDVPRQRIILFSAYLDQDLRRQAEDLGITVLDKRDVAQLPKTITALAGQPDRDP